METQTVKLSSIFGDLRLGHTTCRDTAISTPSAAGAGTTDVAGGRGAEAGAGEAGQEREVDRLTAEVAQLRTVLRRDH